MWQYIVIWTLVTVTQNPCPDTTGKCKARHQSYAYEKKYEKYLTKEEALSLYSYMKGTEEKFKDYPTERITKVKIDSIYINQNY